MSTSSPSLSEFARNLDQIAMRAARRKVVERSLLAGRPLPVPANDKELHTA